MTAADYPRWRELFDAYTRFYEREPDEAVARHVWSRIVDPAVRAKGIGQALIDWVLAEMQRNGWTRVYWATRETNHRARGLYDKYTPHSGFLRYVVPNSKAR